MTAERFRRDLTDAAGNASRQHSVNSAGSVPREAFKAAEAGQSSCHPEDKGRTGTKDLIRRSPADDAESPSIAFRINGKLI